MNLNEWLFRKHISKKDFAELIGYNRTYLHHILAGLRPPSARMIIRVLEATEGQVKLKDTSKKRKR